MKVERKYNEQSSHDIAVVSRNEFLVSNKEGQFSLIKFNI